MALGRQSRSRFVFTTVWAIILESLFLATFFLVPVAVVRLMQMYLGRLSLCTAIIAIVLSVGVSVIVSGLVFYLRTRVP